MSSKAFLLLNYQFPSYLFPLKLCHSPCRLCLQSLFRISRFGKRTNTSIFVTPSCRAKNCTIHACHIARLNIGIFPPMLLCVHQLPFNRTGEFSLLRYRPPLRRRSKRTIFFVVACIYCVHATDSPYGILGCRTKTAYANLPAVALSAEALKEVGVPAQYHLVLRALHEQLNKAQQAGEMKKSDT